MTDRRIKKVYAYDKASGLFRREFSSAREASALTGASQSGISACCSGRLKSAGPYIWSFTRMASATPPPDIRRLKPSRPVYAYYKGSRVLFGSFRSTKEASAETGLSVSGINMCCNGKLPSLGRYIWTYDPLSPDDH